MSMKEMMKKANEKRKDVFEDGKELYSKIAEGNYGELTCVDENLYKITINVSFDIDRFMNCIEYRLRRDIENDKLLFVEGFDDNPDNIVITDIGLIKDGNSEYARITFREEK